MFDTDNRYGTSGLSPTGFMFLAMALVTLAFVLSEFVSFFSY